MSILSLQNEFLIGNSGLRFWIACNARLTLRLVSERGLNESLGKRMRLVWLTLTFRVILAADKIRLIPKLDQLGERSVGRCSRNHESFFVHSIAILHVELVPMAVAFHYVVRAVDFFCQRSFRDLRRPRSEAHAPAFAMDFFALLFE